MSRFPQQQVHNSENKTHTEQQRSSSTFLFGEITDNVFRLVPTNIDLSRNKSITNMDQQLGMVRFMFESVNGLLGFLTQLIHTRDMLLNHTPTHRRAFGLIYRSRW